MERRRRKASYDRDTQGHRTGSKVVLPGPSPPPPTHTRVEALELATLNFKAGEAGSGSPVVAVARPMHAHAPAPVAAPVKPSVVAGCSASSGDRLGDAWRRGLGLG
jgi:hypothetical protein